MTQEGIEVKISSNGKEVDIFEIRKDSTKVKIQNFKTNTAFKRKNKSIDYIVCSEKPLNPQRGITSVNNQCE